MSMRGKSKQHSGKDLNTIKKLLQDQEWQGETIEIVAKNRLLTGLCLLDPQTATEDVSQIENALKENTDYSIVCTSSLQKKKGKNTLSKIAILGESKPAKDRALGRLLPGQNKFKKDLQTIYKRSAKTRLPFSMLLIRPENATDFSKVGISDLVHSVDLLIESIRTTLDPDDLFCWYSNVDSSTLHKNLMPKIAIVMPAAGLNRSKQRAEAIQRVLTSRFNTNKDFLFSSSSIGLGVAYTGNNQSHAEFLESVESCLRDSVRAGGGIKWEKNANKGSSCQVTAEERAQLFSFIAG